MVLRVDYGVWPEAHQDSNAISDSRWKSHMGDKIARGATTQPKVQNRQEMAQGSGSLEQRSDS